MRTNGAFITKKFTMNMPIITAITMRTIITITIMTMGITTITIPIVTIAMDMAINIMNTRITMGTRTTKKACARSRGTNPRATTAKEVHDPDIFKKSLI